MNRKPLILDTNILVSGLLLSNSTPAKAATKAFETAEVLVSDETIGELYRVLMKDKFDKYISREDRVTFLQKFISIARHVEIIRKVSVCRDPQDDKYLELAINGNAEFIITGDEDLLVLDKYKNTKILKPSEYLNMK